MKNGLWAEEVDEPTAQRVADIVGTSSAAGRALRQLAERRLAGEDVVLLKSGRMFFVAPRSQVTNVSKNQRDRRKHGTHLGGIGTRTRLTPEQIEEIRSLNGILSKVKIAEKFGVKRGCVEYWHRHDRDPLPPGESKSAVQKRQARNAATR